MAVSGAVDPYFDVWATFGQERVHLISQSSNDLNLTFVVDEADADGMLPQLHAELIRGGAMPVADDSVFGPSCDDNTVSSVSRSAGVAFGRRRR